MAVFNQDADWCTADWRLKYAHWEPPYHRQMLVQRWKEAISFLECTEVLSALAMNEMDKDLHAQMAQDDITSSDEEAPRPLKRSSSRPILLGGTNLPRLSASQGRPSGGRRPVGSWATSGSS